MRSSSQRGGDGGLVAPRLRSEVACGALAAALALAAGCATHRYDAVADGIRQGRVPGRVVEGVPCVEQARYQCGPAALAMVLGAWGETADVDAIALAVYDEERRTTAVEAMAAYPDPARYWVLAGPGDVDELNSNIGVLLCEDMPEGVRELLVEVQHQLFNLGGELSIPGFELLKPEAVALLDSALEEHNKTLPRLAEFILPAGSRAASLAHVCRTVARRAERAVVALGAEETLKDAPRQYLNRLSDLLFVLARVLNRFRTDGTTGDDVYWKSERMQQGGG